MCTMRYNPSDDGAFTSSNAILATACDSLDFSTIEKGNFNALKLKSERCPEEDVYQLDFIDSETTDDSVTCTFSRDL